jgi:hypothetical protein
MGSKITKPEEHK